MKIIFSIIIVISIVMTSCGPDIYEKVYPTLGDGKYDSEFPYRNSSEELEEISNTLKMVNSLAFYKSYIFNDTSFITRDNLSDELIERKAVEEGYFNQSVTGTATLVYAKNGNVTLLTCAHIVDFPDTIYSYYADKSSRFSKYIESISIKEKQTNYVNLNVKVVQVDILAQDDSLDVALIGGKFNPDFTRRLKYFDYEIGRAEELEWGSFVYIFGFPLNHKMLTKAIVSNPENDNGFFLIDAAINRGYSGGIVMAIRDGVPNFELVGLVRSVPTETNYILRPNDSRTEVDYNPLVPYTGEFFAKKQAIVNYGISNVISIESIIEFINDNRSELESNGFYLNNFKIKNN